MAWRDQGDPPWQADRPLTLENAAAIINARFPSVDTSRLEHIGYGWEFDAILTADRWLFRFPRRDDWSNRFEMERELVKVVERVLPAHMTVTRVELIGPPTLDFPYPFAGHRFIEGVAADAVSEHLLPTVAREIATFLGALHSIPASRCRDIGLAEVDAQHEE